FDAVLLERAALYHKRTTGSGPGACGSKHSRRGAPPAQAPLAGQSLTAVCSTHTALEQPQIQAKPSKRRPSSVMHDGSQRGSQTRRISPPVIPGISASATPTPSLSDSCMGHPGVVSVIVTVT